MYRKLIFMAVVLFTIMSCTKETLDPGQTKAVKVANEWWVNLYLDGAPQYGGFSKIETYNVAANNDSIWVDDLGGNIWNFKCKAIFDANNLTFQAPNSKNENYNPKKPTAAPLTVTFQDAKIMPDKAKSTTGVVTDSIYFKVIFSDDPTNTYEIKGTGRTMWSPDDH
jgi:hypothetical protein